MSAQVMLAQARDHGVQLTGPVPPDTSRQAMAGEGFDISAFTIDWHAHTATCPQGATAGSWRAQQNSRGHDVIRIRFPDRTCAICPVRAKCTRRTSGPRDLVVRPQAEHQTLQRARHDQTTEEWKNHYHRRAGIEGTLPQTIRRPGLEVPPRPRRRQRRAGPPHRGQPGAPGTVGRRRSVNWGRSDQRADQRKMPATWSPAR
ncbi:transposase [Streptomyces sp. GMR22]|uniref:transposase n=1 Tax=Streptomyces sp. GMR22 TaxID=2759524 RepID=UPI0015FB0E34|nr:transposase [Streptomyces sp. GMR22]